MFELKSVIACLEPFRGSTQPVCLPAIRGSARIEPIAKR